jgi:pimeloyl-ACP methyl ester carboxylesterase
MLDRRTVTAALLAGAATSIIGAGEARAQTQPLTPARNVVLVHGLYADGSCWLRVIPLLQQVGLNVTAVQNPLRSLDEDCEFARRTLTLQDGPTVLVAHSYGGEVVTQTGVDPKVSALVYCSARAPDANEVDMRRSPKKAFSLPPPCSVLLRPPYNDNSDFGYRTTVCGSSSASERRFTRADSFYCCSAVGLLLARMRSPGMSALSPLLGHERTYRRHRGIDAIDPKATLAVKCATLGP